MKSCRSVYPASRRQDATEAAGGFAASCAAPAEPAVPEPAVEPAAPLEPVGAPVLPEPLPELPLDPSPESDRLPLPPPEPLPPSDEPFDPEEPL